MQKATNPQRPVDPRGVRAIFIGAGLLSAASAILFGLLLVSPVRLLYGLVVGFAVVLLARATPRQAWPRAVALSLVLAVGIAVQFLTGPFIDSADPSIRFVALFGGLVVPATFVLIPFIPRIRSALSAESDSPDPS